MRDRRVKSDAVPEEVMCDEAFVYTDPFHGNNFLKKLQELYLHEELCDIKLMVESKEILTHKSVLAANSPYFEGMFLGKLIESTKDQVHIKGISYTVLKSLVEFCYTASVKVDTQNALELLSAANMLQFEGIKQCCSNYLQTKLDAHNCLNISNFADLHTCYSLKESADDFSKTHFREVIESDEFLEIPVEQLKSLLANDAIEVISEKDVFDAAVAWVKHDEKSRKKYFTELLGMVRVTNLQPKILVEHLERHPYVQEDQRCLQFVNDAKTYQLLPSYREEMSQFNVNPRLLKTDSRIYLIGGETRSQVFDSMECYSFHDSKWLQMAKMSRPRDGLGVATYDGKIFVSGGYDGQDALSACECYHPERDEWENIAPMNFPRHAFSMAELHGWLYVGGGSDFVNTEYNSVERYDPTRDEWLSVASMSSKREGLVLVSHDHVIYALGGENGVSILNTVERYDPRTGIWYNCASMGYRRRYFGAVELDNKIYSIGGSDYEEDLNTVELFEARSNRWIPIPSMNRRRESVAVVATEDKIFAMGGACVNKETDTVECYDPQLNKWESFCVIPRAKEGMGAVAL
ncbi:kelch-like protein 20 [Hydractinia symbiolongicarpus]|uniref:kelch-like protein 20 n=1 Tax=Hydractinia symbiolongicarpus TaxID=13093 RepID=UPI00254DFE4C|nr:kelch-like protein 20 [Hydractinia symbiolongicarpus]